METRPSQSAATAAVGFQNSFAIPPQIYSTEVPREQFVPSRLEPPPVTRSVTG